VGPDVARVEETILFTFTVSHGAGSDGSPIHHIVLTDSIGGLPHYTGGDDGNGLLEGTEHWTFTATYTVQLTDPSPLTSICTVTGEDSDNERVTGQDIHLITIEGRPNTTIYVPILLRDD
jgi:hypothetical protein